MMDELATLRAELRHANETMDKQQVAMREQIDALRAELATMHKTVVHDCCVEVERMRPVVEALRAERNELLDALEGMAHQYLDDHMCMSAGEEATELLARRYPDRWRDNGRGLDWIGSDDG